MQRAGQLTQAPLLVVTVMLHFGRLSLGAQPGGVIGVAGRAVVDAGRECVLGVTYTPQCHYVGGVRQVSLHV